MHCLLTHYQYMRILLSLRAYHIGKSNSKSMLWYWSPLSWHILDVQHLSTVCWIQGVYSMRRWTWRCDAWHVPKGASSQREKMLLRLTPTARGSLVTTNPEPLGWSSRRTLVGGGKVSLIIWVGTRRPDIACDRQKQIKWNQSASDFFGHFTFK